MDKEKIEGLWFHSREEDHDDLLVYRSKTYDFPRSRAPRKSLNFKPDGGVSFGQPGPADASEYSTGTWDLSDHILTLSVGGRRDVYEVVSVEDEILILRRVPSQEATDG